MKLCKVCGLSTDGEYCDNVICQLAKERQELIAIRQEYEKIVLAWADSGLSDFLYSVLSDSYSVHSILGAHQLLDLHKRMDKEKIKDFFELMQNKEQEYLRPVRSKKVAGLFSEKITE